MPVRNPESGSVCTQPTGLGDDPWYALMNERNITAPQVRYPMVEKVLRVLQVISAQQTRGEPVCRAKYMLTDGNGYWERRGGENFQILLLCSKNAMFCIAETGEKRMWST